VTQRPNLEALEDRCLLSFNPAVSYPVGNPQAIVTADLTNDGKVDLAIVNGVGNTISVLRGNGDGTFGEVVNSLAGAGPRSLAVGDFDKDGKPDVVTTDAYGVNVLLGNGDGSFQAPSSIGLGSDEPLSVAVGDFNGDGKLDLGVTSNLYHPGYYGPPFWGYYGYYYGNWYPGYYEGHATVLLGNGDGSFAYSSTTVLNSGFPVDVVVADVNGDDRPDVLTANQDTGTVSVLLGDGLGGLQTPADYGAAGSPLSLAAGDVNGDGKVDLVTANAYYNNVSVLLGNGLGAFGTAQNYATGNYAASAALADFNHDGKPDIAAADYSDNDLSLFLGRGDGTFSLRLTAAAGTGTWAVAADDFNGDGWPDAAAANSGSNDVSVLTNDHTWPALNAPSVSINDVTVTEGNTGSVSATFTLTLSAAYGQPVTVHYATADGSATAGSDYTAASGDVTFAAGQTTQPLTVAVLGDRLPESTETFTVKLTGGSAFVGDGQGVGTILDNEPRVSVNDVTVTEGNTGSVSATFKVSLSVAYDQPVTVHFDTANGSATAGSDYTVGSGDVTVAAGTMSQTFTVAVLGDRVPESTENFFVNLSGASSNSLLTDPQGIGTILDNEPRISVNDVRKKEGNSGSSTFVFTVSLSVVYDQAVTVQFATADGTATVAGHDYQAQGGTVTIAAGKTTATISIVVYGDRKQEADETFFVKLSSPSSNALITDTQGLGTILNDDNNNGNGNGNGPH
jgi:hypothetical protein